VPVPYAPLVIVIHETLSDAVHAQPVVVVSVKVDDPPPLE
jgi:hypothetical protein